MKRSLRLLFLVAALAVTCWMTTATPAWALPNCDNWQGRACSTPGKLQVCNGLIWYCECDPDWLTWNCW